LEGIDAPESHQAFGIQSKKHLSNMVFGREGTVVYQKTDQYGSGDYSGWNRHWPGTDSLTL